MARMKKDEKEHKNELYSDMYKAVLMLKTEEECKAFFEDLCTPTEISAMEQRFAVATLLMQDKVYVDILEKTKASTATISRVKRMLNYGSGCLPELIEKIGEGEEKADN